MTFEKWINDVPIEIKKDAVWSVQVYRASLYLSDLCWLDIKPLKDEKLFSLSNQLYRSVGSISANITEGYSRSSHKEQARFYEIALGSTREGKDWYFKSRHVLGNNVTIHRIKLLTKITKLLLTMVNERRASHQVQEETKNYSNTDLNPLLLDVPISE